MRVLFLALALALAALPARAERLYAPPEGCRALATLRLPGCLVRHVAACPSGNIVDSYQDSVLVGRSHYSHPALFVRHDSVNGTAVGHDYGPGAPEPGAEIAPGETYTYSREVWREPGAPEPGDAGTEEMSVGGPSTLTVETRRYRVLDLRFRVENPETGYLYRERALMLIDPPLTLGAMGTVYGADGEVVESFSAIPDGVSLEGEPGFRSMNPSPSCNVSS